MAEFVAHLGKLRVKTGGFADGALDGADVGNLRADMEVDELETMRESCGVEHVAGLDQVSCGETELGILAAAGGPFARAFGEEANAQADHRLDFHVLRNAEDVGQLLEFFHNEDDFFSELAAEERAADEARVLVAITDHEAFGIGVDREGCEEFRLAPCLNAEMPWLASVEDFLHDLAELVDLDREHTSIGCCVVGLRYCAGECLVDRLDAVAKKVVEPHHERKSKIVRAGLGDDFH